VGDWHGPNLTLEYPVMVLDAVRDLMLNIKPLGDDHLTQEKCVEIVKAIYEASDDAEKGKLGSKLRSELNCSPAAWASRFAIQHAISKASRSVHMSNQMIALKGLQEGRQSYDHLKEEVNGYIAKGEPKWDGVIWPFGKQRWSHPTIRATYILIYIIDLLLAIAEVLNRIKDSESEEDGVFVVLTPFNAPDGMDGWQDKTRVVDVGTRIKNLLRGVNPALGEEGARGVVENKFHVKRVNEKKNGINGARLMHSKTYCVDSKLLYIGSDNLYPSYNEEHGVWLEDPAALATWKAKYWDGLWAKADDGTFQVVTKATT
jgi:hypothetical protein